MRKKKGFELTYKEFQWLLFGTAFSLLFAVYLLFNFFSNCVFEWPIRLDIKTCWHEQINPSRERAVEKAINLIP